MVLQKTYLWQSCRSDRRAFCRIGRSTLSRLVAAATSSAAMARADMPASSARTDRSVLAWAVCTENLIRVDDVMESPKLAE